MLIAKLKLYGDNSRLGMLKVNDTIFNNTINVGLTLTQPYCLSAQVSFSFKWFFNDLNHIQNWNPWFSIFYSSLFLPYRWYKCNFKIYIFFWNGLLIKSCPKNLGKPSYFTFTVVQYLISMQWACIQGIFYEITLPNTCYVRLTWREERDNASLCKLIATHVLLPGYDQHQSPQLPLRQYLPKIVTEPEIYLKWYFMIKLYKILCYSQQFTKKC